MSLKGKFLHTAASDLEAGFLAPVLHAVNRNPRLTALRAGDTLMDLLFAIDTRIHTIGEAIALFGEGSARLDEQLRTDRRKVDQCIRRGGGYVFKDIRAYRCAVLAAGTFITEARALFQNLANFYGEFLLHYFGEDVGDMGQRFAALQTMCSDPEWIRDLRERRHDLSHNRAPGIDLLVEEDEPRKYEPCLTFNWRPGATEPEDIVPLSRLRGIGVGVDELGTKIREHLIARVGAVR